MADKWPAANGNWSTAANWNGGTLPQPGDDVYADGKTVTIDQDINVVSIQTTQRSGGTAGGGFTIGNIDATITANIVAGTTACLSMNTISTLVTIIGNITGGSASNAYGVTYGSVSQVTLNITGNITGGSGTNSYGLLCNSASTTLSISIIGNVTGGSGTTAAGLRQAGSVPVTITGNILAGTTTSIQGLSVISNGVVTVNGTPIGAGAVVVTTSGRLRINATSTITGTNATIPVLSLQTTIGNCIINGNINSGAGFVAVTTTTNGTALLVNGNVVADAAVGSVGISTNNSCSVTIVGNVSSNGAGTGLSLLLGTAIVIGDVTGGTTGNAISCSSNFLSLVVCGTVTGGSSTGNGIINTSTSNNIYIYGRAVDATAVAVNNTGGTVTITPTTEVITMACVELLNVTEDDTSSEQEITGTFDFQANSPEGGTYYLYRALGASVDSEKRDDFQLYKQFNGPANLPIDNTGTNRFKVQLQGTKGVADKIVTVNIQD